MPTIYDHRGRPVETKNLTKELAAPSLAGVRSVWDTTVAGGLTPSRMASLLRGAATGDARDYLTLAEEMEERDLHYRCEIGKRKLAVSCLPVTVEAASDDKDDQMLADEVRTLVKSPPFRGLLKDLLDGLAKGFSVCEIEWQRGAKWLPAAYPWRDGRFFVFDQESRTRIRLLDEADMVNGIELPAYKFITHLPHLKTGIPLRGGLAMVASWAYLCKNYTVKDWLAFAEVFGMPLRVGKYDAGASPADIEILRMAVANLGSDAAAVIPQSMLIEFVESGKTTGGQDLFQKLADWLDVQVSKGVLGQTATTQGTPGKLGNEDAQGEVREDIRDDDALQLCATINRDLIRPFIDLNWGPRESYPELVLRAQKQEDLTLLTTALEKLVPLGLRVEQSVVRDKLGLPDPGPEVEDEDLLMARKPEPVVAPGSITPAPSMGQGEEKKAQNRALNQALPEAVAFTPEQQAIEDLADRAVAEAAFLFSGNEDKLLAAITGASSFDEAQERLLALFPDLDTDGMAALLEQCLISGHSFGAFTAEAEE